MDVVLAVVCDVDAALGALAIIAAFSSAVVALRSIGAYQRQQKAWTDVCDLLRQAEEARPSQRQAHIRDADRLVAEIEEVKEDITSLQNERLETRRQIRSSAARTLSLEETNAALRESLDDISREADDLVQILIGQRDTAAAEAAELMTAADAMTKANADRRVELADFKWQCEREIAFVTTRAENAVARAMSHFNDLEPQDESSGDQTDNVSDPLLRDAVRAHSRYQHLQLASEAVCAEVKRVWQVEVTALEERVRRNAAALDVLQNEALDRDDRDKLVDCCVKLEDEAMLTEAAAEEAEEEVWTRSVERNRSRPDDQDAPFADAASEQIGDDFSRGSSTSSH